MFRPREICLNNESSSDVTFLYLNLIVRQVFVLISLILLLIIIFFLFHSLGESFITRILACFNSIIILQVQVGVFHR